ncbi:uracil-DNA glycosylase isoform X2 [Nematostella vectensis]|uniref:uracil-DNA glycosylase isoform X2 n=1 Tax=Nematostella vectensis TaxID=45351 RepID=UPI00138FCB9C|nr:uracil-DNA glycosylase isoform X2 [Nematostella vectensis]
MQTGQSKISSFFGKPATKRKADETENASKYPPSKFAKEKDKSDSDEADNKSPISLSPEQKARMNQKRMEAEEKLLANTGPRNFGLSWKKALKEEFTKDYFERLMKFVESERAKKTVYPPEKDVFSFTLHTDIKDTKVVIIGQDPYHGLNQAHGLCFSVQPGVSVPPSLVNIYKELSNDIDGFKHPGHGYLIGWAKQGVLLLNACLTVVASQANSHKEKKKHCILKAVHPSPLSAHRGFLGCKHFSKANEYLIQRGKKPIEWANLPIEVDG